MNRRNFMLDGLLAVGALSSPGALAAQLHNAGSSVPVRITIDGNAPMCPIPPEFLGLGYEISSIAKAGLLSPANSVYVQLVRTLSPQGVIRIGGNTADYAHFSPQASPVSTPFGTIINRENLQQLGGFLDSTGWKLIWCLNLGSGSEDEAIAEAKAVLHAAGAHLLAFEIGNEPDLFVHEKHRTQPYDYQHWLADYRRFQSALRAQLPHIPLAGPDAATRTDWVTRFAADEAKEAVLLTHHYYREGQNPTSTVEKLLAPDPRLQHQLDLLRAASTSSGLPYRICEVNSFSGGGRPGVSDTMASALWVLDYMFTLAANGCSGVNMETGVNQLDFISSYSPIADDQNAPYMARPEYYGMLAFAQAGRGRLLATTLTPTVDEPARTLKAYATQPNPNAVSLTLINKGHIPQTVSVALHNLQPFRTGSLLRLSAPAVDARSGTSLGGSEVTAQGTWAPKVHEPLHLSPAGPNVVLPAFSAAILTLSSGRA